MKLELNMKTTVSAELVQYLTFPKHLALLRELAEHQPNGWASSPEIAFNRGGDDRAIRRDVYLLLDTLCKAGVLEYIHAAHNGNALRIVNIDRRALLELLEAVEQ